MAKNLLGLWPKLTETEADWAFWFISKFNAHYSAYNGCPKKKIPQYIQFYDANTLLAYLDRVGYIPNSTNAVLRSLYNKLKKYVEAT